MSTLFVSSWLFLALPWGHQHENYELVGTLAPEWSVSHWVNSQPLRLEDLRGSVVLVRWWTAPQCPFCRASAPALNEFFETYKSQGLVVIGFYHHKAPTPLKPHQVKTYSGRFGFQFPVAIDARWQTLRRWWLQGNRRGWTSVTFLLDRQGVIRYIHPGGQYVKGDADYASLRKKIEEFLGESGARPLPGHKPASSRRALPTTVTGNAVEAVSSAGFQPAQGPPGRRRE